MAQQVIENNRQGAEVYVGHEACTKKIAEILQSFHLPSGLLPLTDMEELGYNRSTGFVWLRQKKDKNHAFKKIGKTVWYGKEVTSYVEDRKMRSITGVKGKELLLYFSVTDMAVEDPQGKKIVFGTSTGIKKTFPASAFELEQA